MNKIQIKSTTGNVLFTFEKENNTLRSTVEQAVIEDAYLSDANLSDANLRDANLRDANLSDAKNIPQSYIDECSQQILYVFGYLKHEVPKLKEKLIAGEIDGTQYEGECCCLIGTLGNGNTECINKVESSIPFYTKGLHNKAEQWFWQIKKGDTPENNFFARHVLELIDR